MQSPKKAGKKDLRPTLAAGQAQSRTDFCNKMNATQMALLSNVSMSAVRRSFSF